LKDETHFDLFSCDVASCTSSVTAGSEILSCSEASCSLTCEVGVNSCTPLLKNMIPIFGQKGFAMECSDESCFVTEDTIQEFFGDLEIDSCLEGDLRNHVVTRRTEDIFNADCAVLNEDINNALGGRGDASISFDEVSGNASMDFVKVKSTGDEIDMISCTGASCTKTTADGIDTYACPSMSCGLACEVGSDDACTDMLGRVVGNVGSSGVSIACDDVSCDISERMLNMYFGDVACGLN